MCFMSAPHHWPNLLIGLLMEYFVETAGEVWWEKISEEFGKLASLLGRDP